LFTFPSFWTWRHEARPGPSSVQLLNFFAHHGWMTHANTHEKFYDFSLRMFHIK
jgi:hypothetical protein